MIVDYLQTVNKFTNLVKSPILSISILKEKISSDKKCSTIDLRNTYHPVA